MSGHNVTAVIDGCTYEIPDIWIAVMCQNHGCDAYAAVRFWHEQALLEAAWESEHE